MNHTQQKTYNTPVYLSDWSSIQIRPTSEQRAHLEWSDLISIIMEKHPVLSAIRVVEVLQKSESWQRSVWRKNSASQNRTLVLLEIKRYLPVQQMRSIMLLCYRLLHDPDASPLLFRILAAPNSGRVAHKLYPRSPELEEFWVAAYVLWSNSESDLSQVA